MSDTTYIDYVQPAVSAEWLNEINDHVWHDTPVMGVTVHDASVIKNTPAGTIASTNIQDAINELDTEKVSISTLAASTGSSLVGFIQSGTGSVPRTMQDKLCEMVSVKDFGAVGDGVTDDSPAFIAAILKCALTGGGRVLAPYANYKLASTILIPSNVELDLGNSSITGPGIGSVIDLFSSGYLSGGMLVTNIGQPAETQLVVNASVKNGIIYNCGKAFNLYNWIDNCEVSNIKFIDCTYAVYSDRSWYSRYINLFSRGSASGASNAAFYFTSFVNVQQIESLFVEGRIGVGIEIALGANGQVLLNCSAENCATGIKVSGETGPLKFDTCYIENISGIGVDLQSAGFKYVVTFENCWFSDCPTAIRGENSGGGSVITVRESCRFNNCTEKFNGSDAYASFGKIEIKPEEIANNGYPTLPTGYTLGGKMRVEHDNIIHDSVTGLALTKTKVHGSTLIAFEHEGNAGRPKTGTVPFCQHSKSAGTSFSIYVDTKIVYQQHSALLAYKFQVADNTGNYELYGFVFGDQVKALDATGKTVAVSNNGGFVRLALSTFSHPADFYSITGVVRHI